MRIRKAVDEWWMVWKLLLLYCKLTFLDHIKKNAIFFIRGDNAGRKTPSLINTPPIELHKNNFISPPFFSLCLSVNFLYHVLNHYNNHVKYNEILLFNKWTSSFYSTAVQDWYGTIRSRRRKLFLLYRQS